MKTKYPEYKNLDLPKTGDTIRAYWEQHGIFEKSLRMTKGKAPFIFYEGPPSANGIPGIHHVMARA
ncbi:MAG: class I tRNA ligase family protein, partial [Bacteroidales bacterium]